MCSFLPEAADAAAISGKAKGLSNAEKITRAQLLRQAEEAAEARKVEAERQRMEALKLTPQVEPTPNLNRQASSELAKDIQQFGAGNVIHASGIDATLASVTGGALTSAASSSSSGSGAGAIDQHPEKRMKSAFADYEERMLPIVRRENPKLKLSQYKQMIFKEWQKAPEVSRRWEIAGQSQLTSRNRPIDLVLPLSCSLSFGAQNPFNIRKAQEQSLLANTDEWKYGNFRE